MDPFSFHSGLDSRQVFSTFDFEMFNCFWGSKKERKTLMGSKKRKTEAGLGLEAGIVELRRAIIALGGNTCGNTLEFVNLAKISFAYK